MGLTWLRVNAPKQTPSRRGRDAEAAAERFLLDQGYRITGRNLRYPVGELDLVGWDGGVLCVVEVRCRGSSAWGGALASITWVKRRRLVAAARWYLASLKPMPAEVRFDVVSVDWQREGRPKLELVKDAFRVEEAV